jgi:phthalate 4,5-dioxygenase oxygenase subunit
MLTSRQNQLLTEVEGEAPMGRMMRQRHWIPCARSEALVADGAPQAVRLLGENYVAFRATDGRVGFFDEACPHRGASLTLARNEGCALRCIFHAWKFDVSGKVVEVPSEGPRAEAFAERVQLNHYPTFEGGGLLWVFLGEGAPPRKPPLPFLDLPKENTWVSRSITPCNWLQGVEATIDSIHVGTLHQSWISQKGATLPLTVTNHPRYEVEDTDYGLRAAAVRTLADGLQYVRVTEYVAPFVSLVPGGATERKGSMFISVPRDDVSHMLFWGFWDEDGPCEYTDDAWTTIERDPDNYVQLDKGRDAAWGQNREAMKAGHFSGFDKALLEEDMVVQASMGRVVDRSKEHLCSSDVGLVHARRRLLEEIAAFQQDQARPWAERKVRPIDILAGADYAWREPA